MGYTLGREALRQIQHLVRQEMMRADPARRSPHQRDNATQAIYLAKTGAGGIPAMSGGVAGSGTVTVYRIDDDDTLVEAEDSQGNAITVTAYNVSDGAVAANEYIQLKQELASGKLLVDFENC